MRDVYLISGLGADRRVFQFLKFGDLRIHHIDWIAPLKDESIESYAKRLIDQITGERPILVGVSFGGMIAIEIGKLIVTEKIIIISSAKSCRQIPHLKRINRIKFYNYIPGRFLKAPNQMMYWFFGVGLDSEKKLLRSIMLDTDTVFMRWALDKIFCWENKVELNNVVSIHGTNDRLMPFMGADYPIPGGGHLMIINRHEEIGRILRSELSLGEIPG